MLNSKSTVSGAAGAGWTDAVLAPMNMVLAASIAFSVALSRHWGINQDTPLLHYVVFLMRHGFAPYRDIVEMNMPGAYMTEWAVMYGLGPGDIAWRIYDVLLMAVAALAAYKILRPSGQAAGLFGAALITIYHLGAGPSNVGQRDYAIAVLLLAAYALLFYVLRTPASTRKSFLAAAGFAASLGWAATIKPTVIPFAIVLAVAGVVMLRRDGRPVAGFLSGSVIGALVPALAVAVFLHHYHASSDFFEMLRTLVPYHRGNGNLSLAALLMRWLPWTFYPAAVLAACLLVSQRRSLRWPQYFLLLGAGFGIATYIYQGKGWSYHAAPAMFFLLVLLVELVARADASHPRMLTAALGFCALLPAIYVPYSLVRHGSELQNQLPIALARDFDALGGAGLSGHVQCLDWNAGCIDVLYREPLVQSTGFIYDFYLFPAHPAPVTAELQQRFFEEMRRDPPRIIVLTDHDWPAMEGFAKLDRWPEFAQWLDQHYTVDRERHFTLDHPTTSWLFGHAKGAPTTRAYRIYVLKP